MELLTFSAENFIENYKTYIENMISALDQHDTKKFLLTSHTLRGVIGLFGARESMRVLSEMDRKCKDNDLVACRSLFSDLSKHVYSLIAELEREKSSWIV